MALELIKKLSEYKFDLERVKADVFDILKDQNFIPQIGLTHSEKATTSQERILESTGSIYDFESGEHKFKETDFSIFNENYKNTYLYEIYKSVPNIGRFRIMTLDGPRCYTIHRDLSRRYHYAVDTNPDCLFLFPGVNKVIHIPADGYLHLLDTRYRHTFVNGSKLRRIHIVMDDLSSLLPVRD